MIFISLQLEQESREVLFTTALLYLPQGRVSVGAAAL
jgi:hypothetical protein